MYFSKKKLWLKKGVFEEILPCYPHSTEILLKIDNTKLPKSKLHDFDDAIDGFVQVSVENTRFECKNFLSLIKSGAK